VTQTGTIAIGYAMTSIGGSAIYSSAGRLLTERALLGRGGSKSPDLDAAHFTAVELPMPRAVPDRCEERTW
jgi:hypothetical protein